MEGCYGDMEDEIRFVGPHEASGLAWPDVYFRSEYGQLYCVDGAEWRCVLWRDSVVLPLIVRPVPESLATTPDKTAVSLLDAVTPYGYTGAAVLMGAPEPDWDAFWISTAAFLKRNGIVCAFLRCCPYLPMRREAAMAAGVTFLERTTYSVDMSGIDSVQTFMKQSRKVTTPSLR